MKPNRQPEQPGSARNSTRRPDRNRSKAPTPRPDFRFLGKFKTLALLAAVFIALGGWLLPHYFTVHYRLGDPVERFPVVESNQFYSGQQPTPSLAAIGDLSPNGTLQKEAVRFKEQAEDELDIDFRPVERKGQTHYEATIKSAVYTVTAAYRIIDGKPRPMYQRTEGLVVWFQAFWITLALAVLILLIQIVLGFVRSSTLSPQAKKRLSRRRN